MDEKSFTTGSFAKFVGVQPETIRRALCVDGHYLGIRPVKLPNRRLIWAAEDVLALLQRKGA